jgi:hypothetical protein
MYARISQVWVDHNAEPSRIFWLQYGLDLTAIDTDDDQQSVRNNRYWCWLASATLIFNPLPPDQEDIVDTSKTLSEPRRTKIEHIFKFDHPDVPDSDRRLVRHLGLKVTEDELSIDVLTYTVFLVGNYIALTSLGASGLLILRKDTLQPEHYLQYTAEVQPNATSQALAVCAFGVVVPSAAHNRLLWLHNETLFEETDQRAVSYQVTPLEGVPWTQVTHTTMEPCGWFAALDDRSHLLLWQLWPLTTTPTRTQRMVLPPLEPKYHYIWETSRVLRLFMTQGFVCSLHWERSLFKPSLILTFADYNAPEHIRGTPAVQRSELTDTMEGFYQKTLPPYKHFFLHHDLDQKVVCYEFKPRGKENTVRTLELHEREVYLTTLAGTKSPSFPLDRLQHNVPFLEPMLTESPTLAHHITYILPKTRDRKTSSPMSLYEAEAAVRAWAYRRGYLRSNLTRPREEDGPLVRIRKAATAALTSLFPKAKQPRLQ